MAGLEDGLVAGLEDGLMAGLGDGLMAEREKVADFFF